MNLLVDTHLLLWAAGQPHKLPQQARDLLTDPDNQLLFSAASLWVVAIKSTLGRNDFQVNPGLLRRGLLDNGWNELIISSEHAIATTHLPNIHKDPFDRILLAQADVEGFTLLTCDAQLALYPGSIRKL
jgi:PIN domain nuclease of toxin-antitoxin system